MSSEENHQSDVRRTSRSVPNHCYREFTEAPENVDPYEYCDMSSESEADNAQDGMSESFSRDQSGGFASHTRESIINTTLDPGPIATTTNSTKRPREALEDGERESLTVKLKYNNRRYDNVRIHENSAKDGYHPPRFESVEDESRGTVEGVLEREAYPGNEEDRTRFERHVSMSKFNRMY